MKSISAIHLAITENTKKGVVTFTSFGAPHVQLMTSLPYVVKLIKNLTTALYAGFCW